jgi:hypothetical protein
MENWNGGSGNLNDIERDLKQQKRLWNGITEESMEHWILKVEKHQGRLLSEGYAPNVFVDCSGKGWRSD